MIPIDLAGKTALITGGSQGIGRKTACRLHEAGAEVAINYLHDPEGKNQGRAEEAVRSLGDRAHLFAADVRDRAAVATMVEEAVFRMKKLDILVNNAGIIADRTLKKMSSEEWDRVIETNLTGVYNVCRAAVDKISDGGRIVNLSSISAYLGFFGQCNYAAAKAGVVGLTRVMSRELGRRNITVNGIAPGVVLTEMGKTIPEEVRAEMLKSIPLGRLGEQQEIADVVLFLCSDLASYVSGEVIHINGGWLGC